MFQLSPSQVFKLLKIDADPELVDLAAQLVFQFQDARDKKKFLKDAIRKALITEPGKRLR